MYISELLGQGTLTKWCGGEGGGGQNVVEGEGDGRPFVDQPSKGTRFQSPSATETGVLVVSGAREDWYDRV